jgi:hypothetical protein
VPSLLSPPCRAQLDCQHSIELTHPPTNYFTSLLSTELLSRPGAQTIYPRGRPNIEHPIFIVTVLLCASHSAGTCLRSCYQACSSSQSLHSSGTTHHNILHGHLMSVSTVGNHKIPKNHLLKSDKYSH